MKRKLKAATPKKLLGTKNRAFTTDRIFTINTGDINPKVNDVVKALENPKFKWRTIDGISRDTGVSRENVENILGKLGERVVRASAPSTTGETLFTTRQHHKQTETIFGRFAAILRNRAT